MFLTKISILNDNYVWILFNHKKHCIIIDPGESEITLREIKLKKFYLIAILLTHNHFDHVGGVEKILKKFPNTIVFGPRETIKFNINKIVKNGDVIKLLNKKIYVFFTPGHTLGHVSYYLKPYLFCGDVLFSGGCGRVFQEKYFDMYQSIQLINTFPRKTLLCCSHEYTLSNLYFSMSILPNDLLIKKYFKKVKNIIFNNQSSLPVYLFFERKINIFLRTDDIFLKNFLNLKKKSSFEVFKYLRLKKDFFNGAKRD